MCAVLCAEENSSKECADVPRSSFPAATEPWRLVALVPPRADYWTHRSACPRFFDPRKCVRLADHASSLRVLMERTELKKRANAPRTAPRAPEDLRICKLMHLGATTCTLMIWFAGGARKLRRRGIRGGWRVCQGTRSDDTYCVMTHCARSWSLFRFS